MKKINFIVPEISRTGGMRVIFEYAVRLVNRGYDVILYSPNIPFNNYRGMIVPFFIRYRLRYALRSLAGKNKLPDNIFEKNFRVEFLWAMNNFTIRDADATVATSWTTSYIVNRLRKSKGRKFYLVQDYEYWTSNIASVDKSYSFPLNRITVSRYLHELLKQKFNSDSVIIMNGIDFTKFYNREKVFNDPPQILFMDHLLDNKNTKAAIEVCVRLKEEFPQLKFKCFGSGNFHPLPSFIEFIENPDDEKIKALYCGSDIFLYTSLFEGFGLPPAEAMACQCAVVGSRAGAVPDYSINGETAVLTEPGNVNEIIAGVKYLLNNPEKLKEISFGGYQNVKKILKWDNAVDQFEELL